MKIQTIFSVLRQGKERKQMAFELVRKRVIKDQGTRVKELYEKLLVKIPENNQEHLCLKSIIGGNLLKARL